jgi:hypothetical protein
MSRRFALVFLLLLTAVAVSARVISYAPYSDRISVPALGLRLNRHFALVESSVTQFSFGGRGRIVLYDSKGEEEPRVIFPKDATELTFDGVAVGEPIGEPAIILAVTSPPNPTWNFSIDSGSTWKQLAINGRLSAVTPQVDVDYPFVAVSIASDGYHLLAVAADGTTKELMATPTNSPISLAGSDLDRRRFLVRAGSEIDIIDTNGSKSLAGTVTAGAFEGWIAPSGAAYVEQWKAANDVSLWLYANGSATFIAGTYDKTNPAAVAPPIPTTTQNPFFAVPSATYAGAWIVKRTIGAPTQLFFYDPQRLLVEQWSDITAPEVEAIHPSLAGDKVLIQVHRPRRSVDQILFRDPALAVWHTGSPAPRNYDELYLAESADKGFVHLDVDLIENGTPFVFDGGRTVTNIAPPTTSPAPSGGSDVVQEWGVVRGSLVQRLVLPGFGRTPGAFGSLWRSDVTFDNPNDTAVNVTLRFVTTGDASTSPATKSIRMQLAPRELRLVRDAALQLFQVEGAVGALVIEPDGRDAITVTGRTYTQSDKGTYGYGMNAIDIFAAASARFPVTFSGAFQGSNFRTNLFMTDVSGRGTTTAFAASGPYGEMETNNTATETAPLGVLQRNGMNSLLGLSSQSVGALSVIPTRGEAIVSLFSIDNRTNDATFFPPDLSAGTVRTIPVVGHLEGANGSLFRSDLFLYNQSALVKTVTIEMRSWTSSTDVAFLTLTLLPREARVIPDVMKTAFNRTGTARLRISNQSSAFDSSVRLASRTYTVDANGGTYGFVMPPLNSFQTASTGDTLETLGTVLDSQFRTNIGLVDVTTSFSTLLPRARIDIIGSAGVTIDSFETAVPTLGGIQLNDVFRARSLPHDGAPVLIRITPLQGMLGAYAAMLDNATNDSMYFAANLSGK